MTTLLVASVGGHLKQLHLLYRTLGLEGPPTWVTFDRPQSRSLLLDRGESVEFVEPIGSRDPLRTAVGLRDARRILRTVRPTEIVSTGSAIALPYMVIGRAKRIRCRYIESAARTGGPSLTGQMVSRIPGVELQTQYASWASRRWQQGPSVFDVFRAETAPCEPPIRKVVVALGTLRYDFSRLVHRLRAVLPREADVLWQLGETPVPEGLTGAQSFMPEHELVAAMAGADAVIVHAGVGSALSALEVGRVPILVPRRAAHGEHVDDHQELIARELSGRGLAVAAEASELSWGDIVAAASIRVRTDSSSPSSAFAPYNLPE